LSTVYISQYDHFGCEQQYLNLLTSLSAVCNILQAISNTLRFPRVWSVWRMLDRVFGMEALHAYAQTKTLSTFSAINRHIPSKRAVVHANLILFLRASYSCRTMLYKKQDGSHMGRSDVFLHTVFRSLFPTRLRPSQSFLNPLSQEIDPLLSIHNEITRYRNTSSRYCFCYRLWSFRL
jgi:hypothetical protein